MNAQCLMSTKGETQKSVSTRRNAAARQVTKCRFVDGLGAHVSNEPISSSDVSFSN